MFIGKKKKKYHESFNGIECCHIKNKEALYVLIENDLKIREKSCRRVQIFIICA